MQVAIICNILDNKPVGVIGKDEYNFGFITNSIELDEVLDYIMDKNKISLLYNEVLNNNNLLRIQDFDIKSKEYFIALNYVIPEKWKILGITNYDDQDEIDNFDDNLQNIFNALMKEEENE